MRPPIHEQQQSDVLNKIPVIVDWMHASYFPNERMALVAAVVRVLIVAADNRVVTVAVHLELILNMVAVVL